MKIYHIEFAKTGLGLSGGEKATIEVIKYFQKKQLKNVLLTTDNAKATYEKLGLIEDEFLTYKIINSYEIEKKVHVFFSYFLRTFQAVALVKKIKIEDGDVLMCQSEFFPNSIPSYILGKRNNKTQILYWFHMLAPDLFKGYEGQYTGKFSFPKLNVVHYKLNQWLYKKLTLPRGVIITVNAFYKEILKKMYPSNKIKKLKIFGGDNIYVIKNYSGIEVEPSDDTDKKYDLCFVGRFHPQKGIMELVDIAKRVREFVPGVRMSVIGGGDKNIEEEFLNKIQTNKLEGNIQYFGVITGNKKFKIIYNSKIFVFPSYYESFGQVILEAMKCGLPVVAYDLPVYGVFEKGMIRVPVLDNDKMTTEILKLLENQEYYHEKVKESLDYSSNFSWEKTGEEIYNLISANK